MRVLEWKSACALVKLVIPARHSFVARKHNAVESESRKDCAAYAAKQETCLSGPGEATVAVEGARYIV